MVKTLFHPIYPKIFYELHQLHKNVLQPEILKPNDFNNKVQRINVVDKTKIRKQAQFLNKKTHEIKNIAAN